MIFDEDFFEDRKEPLIPTWAYPIILVILFIIGGITLYILEESIQYKVCDKILPKLEAESCDYVFFERACKCCYNVSMDLKFCETYKYSFRNETILLEEK